MNRTINKEKEEKTLQRSGSRGRKEESQPTTHSPEVVTWMVGRCTASMGKEGNGKEEMTSLGVGF